MSHSDAHTIYSIMGTAHMRLENPTEALECYKKAVRLQPSVARHKRNLGTALIATGQIAEAVQQFAEALDLPDDSPFLTYANMAEALALLGLHEDARAAFEEAVNAADLSSTYDLLRLAAQAAEIGADREAVDLYARYIKLHEGGRSSKSSIDIIREAPERLKSGLVHAKALKGAVERAEAFGQDLSAFVDDLSPDQSKRALVGDTNTDEFEATRAFRMRANTAVLTGEDDVR
ncbi:tetratricopeptide repeat protein [Sorangium sp. So ce1151]|uniref:tetratricopeptide repeat protein n=1 Tax=Sorangium sp. So ce1151 TaxID=3133332 RepID=UPI003F6168E5